MSFPGHVVYTLVDLTVGDHGAVIERGTELQAGNPGEALDVVPHEDGHAFWILVFDTAATLNAYLVTEDGIATEPVRSETGITGPVHRGSINHSESYTMLALSFHRPTQGFVATTTFDRASGRAAPATVRAESADIGYHATFSPNASKLYFSDGTEGYMGVPQQLDLETGVVTALPGTGFGAAKLAVDGYLYYTGYNKTSLGRVEHPDEPGEAAGFVAEALDLQGCRAGFGVPNQTAAFLDYLTPPAG